MTQTTNNKIDIQVKTQYLPEHSDSQNNHYTFAYTITIQNTGEQAAKLLSRHWVIMDANSHIQEVHGAGVVGEQPNLLPGEYFEYTSSAVIATPIGSMQGDYEMLAADGTHFTADIPAFSLAVPHILN